MATKKATKSTKTTKTATKAVKAPAKTKKCDCENCKCGTAHSQVSFYILIALLVATMTVLVVSLSFNKSVAEIFKPSTYAYSGWFDNEVKDGEKDESGFPLISAGATIDMINSGKTGFLIISDASSMDSDAFARRVSNVVASKDNIYRYNVSEEKSVDDERIDSLVDYKTTPSFIYVKDGRIFDRLDDVKDEEDLKFFLEKYSAVTIED
ncbi:hypothetical protein IKG13_02015 [Candidatus Saccharibacteria bacterium]|nr:hypothetical protein [Candidatus Saccharibacteria bacterium]MBR3377733.1 hypothetical protein [Candidatus Saccharibacteria bacterium]